MGLVYFVKQFTHIKIVLEPYDRRKPVTKSMLQEVNLNMRIGNRCSRPVGKAVESLVLLQKSHAAMYLLIEARSFGHQT